MAIVRPLEVVGQLGWKILGLRVFKLWGCASGVLGLGCRVKDMKIWGFRFGFGA